MTQNELKAQELAQQREIAEKDRQSRERVSANTNRSNERNAATAADANTASAAIKGMGPFGAIFKGPITERSDYFKKKFATVASGENAKSWYLHNEQLAKDVASISFEDALGEITETRHSRSRLNQAGSNAIAGHMAIGFVPAIGNANGDATAINQAAEKLYSFVRHANSGSRNYDAVDLMEYILSLDSAFTVIAWMCKLYSITLTYKVHNRYYADAILRSEGVNPSDMRKNLSDFRSYLNTVILQLQSYAIPNDWDYFVRHIWMSHGIFKDSEVKKSQTYTFRPEGYYSLNNTDGSMEWNPIGWQNASSGNSAQLSVSQLETIIDQIKEKIIGIEDIGIMSGDILKAFGSKGLFTMETLPENYHIESEFSMEVLSQITSAKFAGNPITENMKIIQQDDKLVYSEAGIIGFDAAPLTYAPAFANGLNGQNDFSSGYFPTYFQDRIVNMYKDEVDVGDIMVATRLMHDKSLVVTLSASGSTQPTTVTFRNVVEDFGSEITTKAQIVWYANVATGSQVTKQLQSVFIGDTIYLFQLANAGNFNVIFTYNSPIANILKQISAFDWGPSVRIMYIAIPGTVNGNVLTVDLMDIVFDSTDYCNSTPISVKNLKSMHNVALNSLINVFDLFKEQDIKPY